ncbi:TonB-dependent receptor [Exilibacterium tricleocarpae]|uniref:TonB-dependent receptor n=1 Tax=Exilibacterium tricleocarpae TaxID=2591008 RepID=A0A545T041_9GAMM|nr:TonB-dependent receptor [Exilibacterium tricleocarpae]TQV70551.1 TonB-dependent receptor [Exilibacterium tricleocarpae]
MSTRFHKTLLSASICSAVALASGVTFAQNNEVKEDMVLEEIVVSGIRSSRQAGLSNKRNSAQFVDSIVSDDIGKLPDANVAESLGRISGVQIDRGIGEGSDISIRGQRQNVILYNGRQIFDATGRGGNGLDQLNTSSYGLLTLVPSEIISSLEVSKLAAASDIEGGLGGIVNITTRKPLDTPGMQFVGSVAGTYEDLADENGHELFAMFSNTFADDTIGVLLTATSSSRELAEHGLNTFSGYGVIADNSSPLSDADGSPVSDDPNGDGVSGLFHLDPRLQQIAEERERGGFSAVLQWQPNDDMEVVFDTFYSQLESDRDRHWIGYFAGFGPHTDVVFDSNEILQSGIVTRPIQTNVEFAEVEAEILSSALRFDWLVTDNLTVSSEVSVTNSESSYDQLFFRLQSRTATDITYDFSRGDFGNFSFPADLTDPGQLNLAILFDQQFTAETDEVALRSDVEWMLDAGAFTSFEFGFRYQELETENGQISVDIRPNLAADTAGFDTFITLFSNSDFLKGDLSQLPRTYLSASRAFTGCESLAAFYTPEQQALCDEKLNPTGPGSLLNSYSIEEEFTSLYAKANFESSIGDMAVSGNIGVRYLERDMTSTGNQLVDSPAGGLVVSPNVFDRTDDEFLPSAVVKVDVNDQLVVRLGAARVIAFPNTEDLNNGLQLFGDFRGVGGNPDLDPFDAIQLDASVEYYFDEGAIISLGVFDKDVDTFIFQSTQQEDIAGFPQPFTIAKKVNGDSADVKGLELLYEQQFTALPQPFDGLGIVATYSYIDSETPLEDNNGRKLTLPGLSENNVNLIVYYETDTFGVRLAYNWRDEYLQGVGPANTGIFFNNYADLSATVNWDINDRYSLNFEALNLLDSQLETYNAVEDALRTNAEYGSIYKLTFTARL